MTFSLQGHIIRDLLELRESPILRGYLFSNEVFLDLELPFIQVSNFV